MAEVVVARLFRASWFWKANRAAVLVADSTFRKVSGIPGVPEATVTLIVVVDNEAEEEAWNMPLTLESALETNPPVKVARLVTDKASPKVAIPVTFKVEEERSTPETWRLPATEEEAEEVKPLFKLAKPATDKVEEAESGPLTFKPALMVEEAEARNPPVAFKAKTVVEAKFWTSKALPVWPSKVLSARLMDLLEVAPMVATALAETLEVPTTN